jgi:hypothetical protein
MPVEFYDSISAKWPEGASHVALYYDSSIDGDGFKPQHSGAPYQRWITRRGGKDAAAHTGAADYESGNLVFEGNNLGTWAHERVALGYRFRVYCQRSNLHLALPQLHGLNPVWWIPTLDGNEGWTPNELSDNILRQYGISIAPASIWGIQWGTNDNYDTSSLWGEW